MKTANLRQRYALPRAENLLYIVTKNIIGNLRQGNPAKVVMAPLVQRAYTIVNETGVIPYQDFDASAVLMEKQ